MRYQKFQTTSQALLKLQLALEGYNDPTEASEHHAAYTEYLKKRKRPAAMQLAANGQTGLLTQMISDHILQKSDLDRLIRESAHGGNSSVWLSLVVLRHTLFDEKQQTLSSEVSELFTEGMKRHSIDVASHTTVLLAEIPRNSPSQTLLSAVDYLRRCRSLLWFYFPYLSGALAALEPEEAPACHSMGTDGQFLYYNKQWVLETWQSSPARVIRCYLHNQLHCIWEHIWNNHKYQKLADIQVEDVICREISRHHELASVLGSPDSHLFLDDHQYWPSDTDVENPAKSRQNSVGKRWEKIRKELGNAATGAFSGAGLGLLPGFEELSLSHLQKSTSDYRRFLQSFAVWKEMQEIDTESFDYIYYSLGMEQYDQIPLIEPLEYKEGHRLEQLVIAIDTSGSVKDDMVRRFLEETYAILDEKENFFDRMEVWIVQCDLVIEDAQKISCQRDWEIYQKDLKIVGRAGTDFRPVFQWIEEKQQQGELSELKGLLYFTDGDGIYPGKKPSYETAFIHLYNDAGFSHAPKWVRSFCVDLFR